MSARYGLASDSFGPEEIEAAVAVMKSGRYTMGEKVREFEQALARWLGVKHALMVNSGSSANLLVIEALLRRSKPELARLKPGDEVLVPGLAWPTTVWPLAQLGLAPVYVDIDPETLAIRLDAARAALTPRTRGMFLIHVLGQACGMGPYVEFCRENGLTLIEDCCESFGAFDQGRHVGSFGFAGTLSHFFSHHLTTMEGGTVITNDDLLIDDLRSLRAHGWLRDRADKARWAESHPGIDPRFLFVMTGYNVRPMEIQAAIGLVQLRKMDQFLAARENVARLAAELVERHAPWMRLIGRGTLPPEARHSGAERRHSERRHSWMNLPFLLDADAPIPVQKVKEALETHAVETRPIIAGNLARHPASRLVPARTSGPLTVCDEILSRGFMIGCHPNTPPEGLKQLEAAFQALGRLVA